MMREFGDNQGGAGIASKASDVSLMTIIYRWICSLFEPSDFKKQL